MLFRSAGRSGQNFAADDQTKRIAGMRIEKESIRTSGGYLVKDAARFSPIGFDPGFQTEAAFEVQFVIGDFPRSSIAGGQQTILQGSGLVMGGGGKPGDCLRREWPAEDGRAADGAGEWVLFIGVVADAQRMLLPANSLSHPGIGDDPGAVPEFPPPGGGAAQGSVFFSFMSWMNTSCSG